ncbi:MAG: TlpA family protein disulfide reductase [Clostridia bacterium]|nr:TlpA family protein disulfide reductase [Clostridia bacterium]
MNKLRKSLLLFLMLSLALLVGCGGDSSQLPIETAPETETADVSPDQEGASSESAPPDQEEPTPIYITFEGTDLEGNTVSQEVFTQSKLTMVNVWATYCNPCLREMPGLGELASEYGPEEFQIIGIVSDVWEGEDQSLVDSLVQETGAAYPHLLANDSINQAVLSSVSGVPTTFFFDGEGAYLGGVVGSAEKSTWEEIVNELLEAQ